MSVLKVKKDDGTWEIVTSGIRESVEIDSSLTESGKAADAKAVGDALNEYAKVSQTTPRNLLINSDFTNPVNTLGETSWNTNCRMIDGWNMYSSDESKRSASLSENGLTCGASSVVR